MSVVVKTKILVLDDDKNVGKTICHYLEREGYESILTENLDESIEILRRQGPFSLMLCDIKTEKIIESQIIETAVESSPDMPILVLSNSSDIKNAVEVMRAGAFDYLVKPLSREELNKTIRKALAYSNLIQYNRRLELDNRQYQRKLEEDVADRTKELSDALHQLKAIHMDTVRILTGAIEEKDPYIRGHGIRVRLYTHRMAEALGDSKKQLEMIDFGALLHDIGKIAIDRRILNKPSSLNPDERRIVETHPLVGERIVSKVSYFDEIAPAIRWHHERWDGNGYPDKLAGEAIPRNARMLSVADTYDAMTSDRAYRKALPLQTALKVLREEAGKQFDVEMVDLFFREKIYEMIYEGE